MSQPMLPLQGSGNGLKPLTPPMEPVTAGKSVNISCDPMLALAIMEAYLDSTYKLQAEDTALEASITDAETKEVQEFQQGLSANGTNLDGTNYIYMLEHFDEVMAANGIKKTDPEYSNEQSRLTSLLSAAQSNNQSKVKIMDGNNSTAQNTLSQNAQGQQGIIQAMSSINGISANLARILQG